MTQKQLDRAQNIKWQIEKLSILQKVMNSCNISVSAYGFTNLDLNLSTLDKEIEKSICDAVTSVCKESTKKLEEEFKNL